MYKLNFERSNEDMKRY